MEKRLFDRIAEMLIADSIQVRFGSWYRMDLLNGVPVIFLPPKAVYEKMGELAVSALAHECAHVICEAGIGRVAEEMNLDPAIDLIESINKKDSSFYNFILISPNESRIEVLLSEWYPGLREEFAGLVLGALWKERSFHLETVVGRNKAWFKALRILLSTLLTREDRKVLAESLRYAFEYGDPEKETIVPVQFEYNGQKYTIEMQFNSHNTIRAAAAFFDSIDDVLHDPKSWLAVCRAFYDVFCGYEEAPQDGGGNGESKDQQDEQKSQKNKSSGGSGSSMAAVLVEMISSDQEDSSEQGDSRKQGGFPDQRDEAESTDNSEEDEGKSSGEDQSGGQGGEPKERNQNGEESSEKTTQNGEGDGQDESDSWFKRLVDVRKKDLQHVGRMDEVSRAKAVVERLQAQTNMMNAAIRLQEYETLNAKISFDPQEIKEKGRFLSFRIRNFLRPRGFIEELPEQEDGFFDINDIPKLVTRTGNNFYYHEVKTSVLDNGSMAVAILIDMSSSMAKLTSTLQKTAAVLGETFHNIGAEHDVRFLIAGFNGRGLYWFKHLSEPWTLRSYRKIGSLKTTSSTPLGEALRIVGSKLLEDQANRKIIFILTDGSPNNTSLTKRELRSIQNEGVEIIPLLLDGGAINQTAFLEYNPVKINSLDEFVDYVEQRIREMFVSNTQVVEVY